jgi:hypothetical protein
MRTLAIGLALFLGAFALYWSTVDFDYVHYDDVRILAEHPALYAAPTLGQSVKAILSRFPREEPLLLRDLMWAVEARVFGFPDPRGFHLINVVLHAGVVWLGFVFLLEATRRQSLALLASLVYLVLAVSVEPVAWIMGRKDLLAAFFGLAALIAHGRALDAKAGVGRWAWYGASLLGVTLALFSKISAVVFPGVLFLLALCRPALRGEEPPGAALPGKRVLRALGGVAPHLVISLWVGHWYQGVLSEFGLLNRGYTATPWQHLGTLMVLNPLAWLRDLQLILWPGEVPFFHSWPGALAPVAGWQVALAVPFWLALAASVWALWRKRRDYAFPVLAFFVLLIPYMNLRYIGIWVASRYLYLASFCVVTLLAMGVLEAWRRPPRWRAWTAAALLAACTAANAWSLREYLPAWRGAEALWTRELRFADAPADAYYNLAAFSYTAATSAADPGDRERLLQRTSDLVARAKPRFDPSLVSLQHLLLLDALVAIAREAPPERQRAALLEAERAGPRNEAILWQCALFHYRQALAAPGETVRRTLALQALAYYRRHRALAYKGAGSAARDRAIRAEFAKDFPFLGPDLEALP